MKIDQLIKRAESCHASVSGLHQVKGVVESIKTTLTKEIRIGNDVPGVELESGYSLMSIASDANCLSVYEGLKPILGASGFHHFVERVAEINPKALAQFIAAESALDYEDVVDETKCADLPLRVVNSQSIVKIKLETPVVKAVMNP